MDSTLIPPEENKIGRVAKMRPGTNYSPGRPRSVRKLEELRFDPIEKLVRLYEKLERDLEWYENIRDSKVVLVQANGKARYYDAKAHMECYNRMISIGESLLRYKYGRVAELQDNLNTRKPSLTITLTQEGEEFVLNPQDEEVEEFDDGY